MKVEEVLKEIIADVSIPITFRNSFKRYLKWKSEQDETEDNKKR